MKINTLRVVAGLFSVTCLFSFTRVYCAPQPAPCDDPVVVGSLIVTNSTCGDSSGVILISLAGGNDGYTFTWTPNVSDTNIAFGLKAAAYHVKITRTDSPDCSLDTTILVNNTNGPSVSVQTVVPSNCLASNGSVSLAPQGFDYAWSNGETGATNTGLSSGCYTVTATNPGTGCYSVLQVCVPNVNPLQSTYTILEPSKCGLPTGRAEIKVTGGSGQYSYSFGADPIVTGLAPGAYTFYVVDNLYACLDTIVVVMGEGPVQGDVVVQPFNIKCAGTGQGNVEFDVIPGANFKSPYTFALWDENGMAQSPGNLAAGTYYLQIADADSCLLPVDTFTISEPPPFAALTNVQPKLCDQGGSLQLTLSGGNGRYLVDWFDLPGFNNPEDRLHLDAGYYSATVYDSLFCAYPIDSVFVPAYCNIADTLVLVLGVNTTDSLCLPFPAGVGQNDVTFAQVGQSGAVFGSWMFDVSGCLKYTAGPVPAFGVDPICVAVQTGATGLNDTVCVLVYITAAPPDIDSIYFAVQSGNSTTACGQIPVSFNNKVVSMEDGSGLTGASDAFGTYVIDPVSACITFQSSGPTGYNVDRIGVLVCDPVLRRCHTIRYFPTVLSPNDCLDGIALPGSLDLSTDDCDNGASGCVPIPFTQVSDYVILDNGLPYSGGAFSSCNPQNVRTYTINLSGGPYQMGEWVVNGQAFSGFFTNAYELLGLMNQNDPAPGWSLENDSVFIGGNPASTYGNLIILSAQNQTFTVSPMQKSAPLGTNMRFAVGLHTVIFRRAQTGCLDTMPVKVVCTSCPPVHNYTPGSQGVITWAVSNCSADTVFCTTIPEAELADYTVTDNSQPFTSFTLCSTNIGLRLDTGYHDIHFLHNLDFCEYQVRVELGCDGGSDDKTLLAVPDEAVTPKNTSVEIDLVANDIIRGIVGNRMGLDEFVVLANPAYGQLTFDDILGVVAYTPEHDYCGVDTFIYRISDTTGLRSSARVKVTVLCDKVLVYTGISPNGDNRNDYWSIPGIEQFPECDIQVFNRWGNLVFKQKGYSNLEAWNGTWNGHALPDGAYFYIIDLGDGSKPLSGYIQIMR
jgi:gliding motility-associated-like protein